jgi:hypothetical protein
VSCVLVSFSLSLTFAEPVHPFFFCTADEDFMNIAKVLSHEALLGPFLSVFAALVFSLTA